MSDTPTSSTAIRTGCIDLWNAFMVKDAEFTTGTDMPMCFCSSTAIPTELISYEDAKHLHKMNSKNNPDYHVDAYIHFYIDDQKFDGKRTSIWQNPHDALEIIRHFSGAITPDFSTYADFPDPLKRYNTYRMRAFGTWLIHNGIPVINNVRWGTEETWAYCFDGIPANTMVAIGTVASGINKLTNRPLFELGLFTMIDRLHPHTIIIYGSSNHPCFKEIKETIGITIVTFPSKTSLAFASTKGGVDNE